MVRSFLVAASLLAVASAQIALTDSTAPGWSYKECIVILQGAPIIGAAPDNVADPYTPEACQQYCADRKAEAGTVDPFYANIIYAAVAPDFCECFGPELDANKQIEAMAACETPCEDDVTRFCGTFEQNPNQWYYAVYEYAAVDPTSTSAEPTSDMTGSTAEPTSDMPTSDVTTSDVSTSDVPTSDVSTSDMPTSDVPTSDVPTSEDPTTTPEPTSEPPTTSGPMITATVTETVVETVTTCPSKGKCHSGYHTKTIVTETCYPASIHTKTYEETITISKCDDYVVDCPHKPTTSVKPCTTTVTYDPSSSKPCGDDLCPMPTIPTPTDEPCDGYCPETPVVPEPTDEPCDGYCPETPVVPEPSTTDGYQTAGAARESGVAAAGLMAGLGLGVVALF